MRIRSTGLGETELICIGDGFSKKGDYLMMSIQTTEPVRWHVRVVLDGKDMVRLMWEMTKALFAVAATWSSGSRTIRGFHSTNGPSKGRKGLTPRDSPSLRTLEPGPPD